MANLKESSRRKDEINLTLKVKAIRKKNGPIEFTLDLNPESKLLNIKETLSSYDELTEIFNTINQQLKTIYERTRHYNDVLRIDEEKKKVLRFNSGYDQNFKPEFGKIDKIIFERHSPSEATVSYARSYNGDKKPPND